MGSADGHESAASLSARVRWVTLAAMTLSASMILVDQTSIPLAIPHIVNGLDSNPDLAQWVLTANVLLLAELIDWRAVFYVNVPLAIAAILLTLSATPALGPGSGHRHPIDYPGTVAFGIGMAGIVLGLGHGQSDGWGEPLTLAPLVLGVIALAAFFVIERRTKYPLVEFKLLRRLNFLAANLSQMLAGAVELGLGFLIPSFLLLIIGFDPLVAGLALIPSTVPVILFGPLAGRLFDRVGGRIPLVAGFLILALAGVAL